MAPRLAALRGNWNNLRERALQLRIQAARFWRRRLAARARWALASLYRAPKYLPVAGGVESAACLV